MNVTLITKAKDIDTAILNLHTNGQKLQHEMHTLACSVLVHFAKHQDKRVVLKLLQAMPESARVNSLRDWFNEFGTMVIGEKDMIVASPDKKLRLAMAMDKPFWKFSPEKAYVPLVIADYIEAQVKKLRDDGKKTNRDHSLVINALLATKLPAGVSATAPAAQ